MARAGYTGTSVREMAAGSGVSVAAMYYHFPSKHDLLREFLDQSWRTCVETVEDRLDEAPDRSFDRLDVIVGTLIELANHDRFAALASSVAIREHVHLDEPERILIEQHQLRLLQLVVDVIVQGVRTGDFRTAEPVEAARAILALTSASTVPGPDPARPLAASIAITQRFAQNIVRT